MGAIWVSRVTSWSGVCKNHKSQNFAQHGKIHGTIHGTMRIQKMNMQTQMQPSSHKHTTSCASLC